MTQPAPTTTSPRATPAPLTLGAPQPFWMPLIVEHCDEQAEPAAMRFDLQVLDVGREAWRAMMVDLDERMADSAISDADKEDAAVQILLHAVIGWRHVQDAQGEALPFTPANFRRLLDIQGMALAILQAYDHSCPRALPGSGE